MEDEGTFRITCAANGEEAGITLYLEDWDGDMEIARAPAPSIEAWTPTSRLAGKPASDLLEHGTTADDLGGGCFRVEHALRAKRSLRLRSCTISFRIAGGAKEGGYRFVPHLHPEPRMVAPDQVFRSP